MSKIRLISIGVVVAALLSVGTALAGSNSTTLPNGANLAVSVDDPATGTEFLIPTGVATRDITVSGTASVGQGTPNVTLVYVIDVSYSTHTASGGSCGGDVNGDGGSNEVLDCEAAAILALNSAAISGGSVGHVGVVVFGEHGAAADMTSGGADDPLTAPNANGDVATVVTSVKSPDCDAGVGQFTNKIVGCDGTDFSAGLAAATTVVNASTDGTKIVVFLSDGVSNEEEGAGFAANLATLQGTGAIIRSFAVGGSSTCTGGSFGTLANMDSGCQQVSASQLPLVLPDLISTSLDSLQIQVDGGAITTIPNSDISLALPQPGAVGVTYSTPVTGLAPGDHTICVTANGSDSAGSASTTQCETIHLLQISLAPETAINELGTPGQTHTVTATVLGPASGPGAVGGRTVNFNVISGPNAGASGSAVTDASGLASFTYTATQGLAGIGTDTIEACVTLNSPLGETGCDQVTKTWADTTPPVSACTPTTNPHGSNVPPAGNHSPGQNEDGFYVVSATDSVDPFPQVYVLDTGSGTVFGPFPAGTKIKYTESPGATPSIKKIGSGTGQAGAVVWHITGKGDAFVYSVDSSGNQSSSVACLVPPPPK